MTDVPRSPFGPEWQRIVNEVLRPLHEAMEPIVRQQQIMAQRLSDQMRAAMPRFDVLRDAMQDFARSLSAGFPQNWLDLAPERSTLAPLGLVEETGWCLIWVPRASVLSALLDAPDPAERERVLLESKRLVVEDLRGCLDSVTTGEMAEEIAAAREAVGAFSDGHYRSAQALATSTIDAVIWSHLDTPRAAARDKFRGDPREEKIRTFRVVAVLNLVSQAMKTYRPGKDPIPVTYNRHATAHTVSSEQLTELNGLASLMLVVALLKETAMLVYGASR